ncbi:MAG: hypothetical protein WAV90_05710 [Gordonia amarae]
MSTVAQMHPPRVDANGTTWYRAGLGRQDGWTSDPTQADPSYAAAASLCSTDGATAGDRAAILEFAAELAAKSAHPDPAG